MPSAAFEKNFVHLTGSGYRETSPVDRRYNCIAWAAGDNTRWWQPVGVGGYYWPEGIAREVTLESYELAFKRQAFRRCDSPELEEGYEKVALYTDSNGVPTHAARQLDDGYWASKLGQGVDIEHARLEDVGGAPGYGEIALIMRRPRRDDWPHPSARNVLANFP